jgi:hypothetical protein
VGDIKRMAALMGLLFGVVFGGLGILLIFTALSHVPLEKLAGAIPGIIGIPGGFISIYQLVSAKKTTPEAKS